MNGGKPIKESRDVDLPLAAAHFFYYAGWADKLDYAFPNREPKPIGVAGQIIPWNFPLLMAAWKLAPALATGNTVVLKPAETTPLTATLLAQVIHEAELPPGALTSSRLRGDRRAPRRAPRRRQDRFTGATRSRRRSSGRRSRDAEAGVRSSSAASPRSSCSRTPTRPGRRCRARPDLHNQGQRCTAGSRLLVERPLFEPFVTAVAERARRIRVGRSVRQATPSIGPRSRSKASSPRSMGYVDGGRRRGRRIVPAECGRRGLERGNFLQPTLFTNVSQSHRIAREEIFGPGAVDPHLPNAGRGGREGEQHAVRPVRRDLDREGLADPVDGRAPEGRRGVGEHVQPVRPGVAVRRLQGERVRARGRPARASSRTWSSTGDHERPGPGARRRSSTSPASSPGASRDARTRSSRTTGGCSRAPRAPRARTCATRSGPRAPRSRSGRARPRTTGRRSCTASPS